MRIQILILGFKELSEHIYLLVVIKDSVHVFNPHSINGSIKNQPFSVRGLCW